MAVVALNSDSLRNKDALKGNWEVRVRAAVSLRLLSSTTRTKGWNFTKGIKQMEKKQLFLVEKYSKHLKKELCLNSPGTITAGRTHTVPAVMLQQQRKWGISSSLVATTRHLTNNKGKYSAWQWKHLEGTWKLGRGCHPPWKNTTPRDFR